MSNKNITAFYVANKDNVTVAFGSNLKEFYNSFKEVYPDARNYQYFYREFQKINYFEYQEYLFQKLI